MLDPTSACNLQCTGCWAAEYEDQLNLSFETWDDIISPGNELGTYMYIFSGGEPLVRKKDVIALCEKHSDCQFLAFTNATLIDEEFADEMLRVKNFMPAISVEGFEKDTDDRRGKGTYKKVMEAMEILKRKKLAFGISCCYTSKNAETIGSEEYIDDMIARGAKFAWFFTYMPVGAGAVLDSWRRPNRENIYIIRFESSERPSLSSPWIFGTMVSLSTAVSQEEEAIFTSMRRVTLSRVPSFTTPIPT